MLRVGPAGRFLSPDETDHADGATMTTPLRKPVFNRCAMLVRVITVLPKPMSSQSIGWARCTGS